MLKVIYEDFSMINFNTEMHTKQIKSCIKTFKTNGQHFAKMEYSFNLLKF